MSDQNQTNDELALLEMQVTEEVLEVWNLVMTTGKKVISHWTEYGYDDMAKVPNPNIHALLVPVREMEEKLDKILANEALEYDESRFVLNAKQQILWMETVAAALIAGRREDFDAAIQKIKNQAHV